MTDQKSREWPLVVFTVGLQVSVGIALVTAAIRWLQPATAHSLRPLAISIFPLALVAIAVSLFHVGRPLAAWRSLVNLGQSRLSNEVAVSGLFAALAFFYSFMWWKYGTCSIWLALATAIVGVLAVISSAGIYTIPAQLLWNSGWVLSSFIGSTLLLGGVAASPFVSSQATGSSLLTRSLILIGASLVLASTALMAASIWRLSRNRYTSPEAAPTMRGVHWLSLYGLIMLAGLTPLVATLIASRTTFQSTVSEAVLLVSALIGVTLGRALMYSQGTNLSRF